MSKISEKETGGVARTSFSIEPNLLREFDRISKLMGYEERSKALQIALRNFVGEYQITHGDENSSAVGTVLVLYNHEKRGIDAALTEIGHEHSKVIISSLHVHLENSNCLSVIAVKGQVRKIMELEQSLRKLGGVIQLRFAHVVGGKPSEH